MKFYLHSFTSVNNSAKFEMVRKVNEQCGIVVRLVKSWDFSGCEFCERDSVGVERRKVNKKGHCVVRKGSLIQPSRFCNDYSSTDSPYWSFTGKEIERLNIVLRNLKDFQDSLGFPSMERFHSGYRTCRIF